MLSQLYTLGGSIYSGPGTCGKGTPPNAAVGDCSLGGTTVWCLPNPGTQSSAPTTQPSMPSVTSPTGTDLIIANNTGYANSAVYVYAIGGGQYLQANGTLAPMGATPIPPLSLAATGATTVPLPYMNSARIYFSINAPLQISQGVQPGFGASVTQLYDWVELNYGSSNAGQNSLFINTTQVDMFSLPITITISSPTGGTQTVGLLNGSRSAIFSAFQADPVLKNLIVGNNLRILAPDHGIDSGLIPSTYLDAYINQVWSYYQSNTISLNAGGGIWSGNVSNGTFVFTQGRQTLSVAQPTGSQVFGCALQITGSQGGAIAPALCAGLNRGTLIDGAAQPDYNAADFYNVTPTNMYAKIIHQYSINGKAYAFPYDDAGDFSSTLAPINPTTVTITLSSF
jgi:Beta-1,3-glucanase